jgi:hypothetical protein
VRQIACFQLGFSLADGSSAYIYRYSSGIGISVSLPAAHIAGCSSGRASVSAIRTSVHYHVRQYRFRNLEAGVTDMVLHITRLRILSLEVHDSHIIDLSLKWYRDIDTQLSGSLDGHILQDDVREVVPFLWYPVPGVEGCYKVSRMAGEREECAGAAGVCLRVAHNLPFSVLEYANFGPETDGHLLQNGLYSVNSGRVHRFAPRDIHGYWTWKPACAADVRSMLLLRANRPMEIVEMQSIVDRC